VEQIVRVIQFAQWCEDGWLAAVVPINGNAAL
jgi:hypothetical protein